MGQLQGKYESNLINGELAHNAKENSRKRGYFRGGGRGQGRVKRCKLLC